MFQTITNIDDSRIALFRSLRLASGRFEAKGLFLVEGEVSFKCLLESECRIHTLFMEEGYLRKYQRDIQLRLDRERFTCLLATDTLMSKIVGFRLHQGIMALAERPENIQPEHLPLPAVALNRVEKAGNTGTIIRTAVALGVTSFIFDGTSCDPLVRRAVRVSMGAVLFSRLSCVHSLFSGIERLRGKGDLKVISLEQDPRSEPLGRVLPTFDILIAGNEGRGIDEPLLSLSDRIIQIPMVSERIRSLNVGVSLGIALSRMVKDTRL